MSKSKHIRISLTDTERTQLETLITSGHAPARTQTRARILLLSDRNVGAPRTEAEIAAALLCNKNTVGNIRRRCAEAGVDAALVDKLRPGAVPRIDGATEAKITLLACSTPPQGKALDTAPAGQSGCGVGLCGQHQPCHCRRAAEKTRSSPGK